jgi:hypothetical protein
VVVAVLPEPAVPAASASLPVITSEIDVPEVSAAVVAAGSSAALATTVQDR